MTKQQKLGLTITVVALFLALAHLLFPSIKIDFVVLVLLLLAALPWLAPLVKSVELPGGLKIELQDVKEAAEVVIRAPVAEAGVNLAATADIKSKAEVIKRS